jgi:hypothetical protein
MNVYALVGKVEGDAQMTVFIDDNLMLDKTGTDCSGVIQPPLCSRLKDKTFILPVEPKIDAFTWGLGTTLASGWRNWFVAIPLSINVVSPAGSDAEGYSFTFSPRGGRNVNLGSMGRLSLFVGGNYLDSEYQIDGSWALPDSDLNIDYTIDQKNEDNWNCVLGFNWYFNRYVSLAIEYDGFVGSREAFIFSFVVRF